MPQCTKMSWGAGQRPSIFRQLTESLARIAFPAFCGALLLVSSLVRASDQGQSAPPSLADAKLLETRGVYEQAIVEYRAVLQVKPSSEPAALGLARTLAQVGQCDEAASVLKSPRFIYQRRGERSRLI